MLLPEIRVTISRGLADFQNHNFLDFWTLEGLPTLQRKNYTLEQLQ
jgi:hypothetical protein